MTPEQLLHALRLPASCLVQRRLPKTLLDQHGAARAGDKQVIAQGIASANWLASLKPASTGIAEHHSDTRAYVELAVLHVELKPGARSQRLIQLLHAALPHPLLLLTTGGLNSLSLAHKRIAPGNHRAVDGAVVDVQWSSPAEAEPHAAAFLAALAVGQRQALELPAADLAEQYQRWIEATEALLAARRSGRFALPVGAEEAARRRQLLHQCSQLDAAIAQVRAAGKRETDLAAGAALNLRQRALRTDLTNLVHQLTTQPE